jgi:hypothetical protein
MLLVLRHERVPRRLLALELGHRRTHDHRDFLLRPRLRLVIVRNTRNAHTLELMRRDDALRLRVVEDREQRRRVMPASLGRHRRDFGKQLAVNRDVDRCDIAPRAEEPFDVVEERA